MLLSPVKVRPTTARARSHPRLVEVKGRSPWRFRERELNWRRAKRPFQGILLSADGLHANERLRSVRVLSHAHDPLSHGTSRNISLPRCQHLPVFRIFTSSICLVAGSTDCSLSGFGTLLSRSTHSAEKATEVSRQCDDDHRHSLDRQAISRQSLFVVLSGSPMNEPHHTDQET